MSADEPAEDPVGTRIKELRQGQGLSLSALARASGVSKGYIWSLENPTNDGPDKRPSAKTLYAIAQTLGVPVAELLGERLTITGAPAEPLDPSLTAFAAEENLSEPDVEMLASIRWRGDQPRTIERWRRIYRAIILSDEKNEGPTQAK
jgi:transcriptional regulator with XRE-family HTH domain